ncbi:zinc finger HIT domain-containing protein 2 [Fopius arisanus]|uniref:Zinc finger HIT domain-containing protein 2 n=1 Tax=Fopius arisanus TaxID=64838 RepID=A0A0C9QWC1_9HYME|nr:PREDICTED: zinc finger HIT domain-containing protein 2 [Fopius arisanus]
MADVDASSNLCQICNSTPPKYTCPRCSISYCSMNCYKSTSHLNCSEEFYKKWVEDEMKSQTNDPAEKKKMTEILKRIHEQEDPFDNAEDLLNIDDLREELDSDDDEDVPDLADRIENVDLDDANELWEVLTDSERQEFEALLRNGEEQQLLPNWRPWWSLKNTEKQLIKEIDRNEKKREVEKCPRLLDITYIPAVEKSSPTVPFNLVNLLSSYVLVVLHYDGDHQNSVKEAVSMFLQLCDNIADNRVFDNEESAVDAVTEKASDLQLFNNDEENVIIDHLKQIIQGPSKEEQNFYMLSAVSDLHHLLTKAKRELSSGKQKRNNPLFFKKFGTQIDEQYMNRSKKCIPLYLKKIEYYFTWIHKYSQRMLELNFLQ